MSVVGAKQNPSTQPFCAECIEERDDLAQVKAENGRMVMLCTDCREGPDLRRTGPLFVERQANAGKPARGHGRRQ